jgi:AcrR family transcriptional regulator
MLIKDKKPYHHGDLRESLLAAAEAALAELPLEQVSLREIARRAGVSHAAPKHHFSTLGHMLGEVAARGFERFVAALDEAANRSPDQAPSTRLVAMGRAYVKFAASNPAVYGLMFGRRDYEVQTTPRLAAGMFAAWSQLEDEVRDTVGPAQATNGAVAVWATVHGLAMLRMDRKLPPNVNPDSAVDAAVRTLVAGLEAEH